jgi:phosphoribosylglycinamide formyltransferase-1
MADVLPSIGVLISGRGSNLQALIDAIEEQRLHARIAIVISNRDGAPGLERARAAGIDTLVVSHRDFPTRDAFDQALAEELRKRAVSLVCLAGFMRLVGAPLLEAFPNAILNVHPSLLPAFPGVDAQRQALEHGVRITGCTVHLVDEFLDSGPILIQSAVPVLDGDTVESLSVRILAQEHVIYSKAIQLLVDDRVTLDGRRAIIREEA